MIVLTFDCSCGFSLHSGEFKSHAAYAQVRDVHVERCIKTPAARALGEVALAAGNIAGFRALSPRVHRQATGVEPITPLTVPPVANHSRRGPGFERRPAETTRLSSAPSPIFEPGGSLAGRLFLYGLCPVGWLLVVGYGAWAVLTA